MSKNCIFKEDTVCTNCGDCDICDLDKNKICDNCGKCLDIEGYDSKSVFIDKIIEDETEIIKFQSEEDNLEDEDFEEESQFLNDYDDDYESTKEDELPFDLELIDDIDGLNELLEDEEMKSKLIEEKTPGFYVIKKGN